jgi:hypothetical protein
MLRPGPAVPIERPLTVEEVIDAPRPPDARCVASAGGRRGRSRPWPVRKWVGSADGALQSTVATDYEEASRRPSGSVPLREIRASLAPLDSRRSATRFMSPKGAARAEKRAKAAKPRSRSGARKSGRYWARRCSSVESPNHREINDAASIAPARSLSPRGVSARSSASGAKQAVSAASFWSAIARTKRVPRALATVKSLRHEAREVSLGASLAPAPIRSGIRRQHADPGHHPPTATVALALGDEASV